MCVSAFRSDRTISEVCGLYQGSYTFSYLGHKWLSSLLNYSLYGLEMLRAVHYTTSKRYVAQDKV